MSNFFFTRTDLQSCRPIAKSHSKLSYKCDYIDPPSPHRSAVFPQPCLSDIMTT